MNGYNPYDDEVIRQLLGNMQSEGAQSFQAQMPQLTQGLLGDSGQEQQLQDIIARGRNTADQMQAQTQPQMQTGNDIAQRQAMSQQMAMQSANQQEQKEAQAGQMLGMLAKMFLMGGGA